VHLVEEFLFKFMFMYNYPDDTLDVESRYQTINDHMSAPCVIDKRRYTIQLISYSVIWRFQ